MQFCQLAVNPLQHVETYLREKDPDLVRDIPAVYKPVEFADISTEAKVILELPKETPDGEIVPDVKPLQVTDACA